MLIRANLPNLANLESARYQNKGSKKYNFTAIAT
jgi:hypothetical protein